MPYVLTATHSGHTKVRATPAEFCLLIPPCTLLVHSPAFTLADLTGDALTAVPPPQAFGAPTGRKVKYHGIANCYIKQNETGQWQYTREWDLPDMWSFITALNLTASQLSHPKVDQVPVDDCKPLFDWKSGEMNWFPPIEPALAR